MFGVDFNNELNLSSTSASTAKQGQNQQIQQTQLNQAAIDRFIYEGMSQAGGLSDILSGSGLVGGNKSSTATLASQDFMTKLAGELAKATATTITTGTAAESSSSKASTKSGKSGFKTIICTRLKDLGYISLYAYTKGNMAAPYPDPVTFAGYHFWAIHVVPLLGDKNPKFTSFWKWLVLSRYEFYRTKKHSVGSVIATKILDPMSYGIGLALVQFPQFKVTV
jgi:hypothetical protein